MLAVNCKDCLYRKFLASEDIHIWAEDCDHYEDDLCRKMCDPGFVEWLKARGKNAEQEETGGAEQKAAPD